MLPITGKLTDIFPNKLSVIIEDKFSNRYFVNTSNINSVNKIGDIFTTELTPKYSLGNIIQNPRGKYKFISFIKDTNNTGINYIRFLNNSTGKIISISVKIPSLNDNVLGINYDLTDLKQEYAGLSAIPFIPENANKLYSKVTITKKIEFSNNNYTYEGIYNNKIISIITLIFLDDFIGKPIYIELVRRYYGIYLIPGNIKLQNQQLIGQIVISSDKLNYITQLLTNPNDIKSSNSNNLLILSNAFPIDPNNVGKIIIYENYDFKFINIQTFRLTENKSDIKLISILIDNTDVINKADIIYLFQTSGQYSEIFAYRPDVLVDLSEKIGSYFSFEYFPIYYLLGYKSDIQDNSYKFESIINNKIHLFSKDGDFFYVNMGQYILSPSLVGNYFGLDIKKYSYSNNILDIKN